MIKEMGFAKAEIAPWVMRPKAIAKKAQTPTKTAEAQPKTARTLLLGAGLAREQLVWEHRSMDQ